jgi:putative oxidoreductase
MHILSEVEVNIGLLLLHAFLGAALVAHAFQKLLVFRLSGTTSYVASLGFRSPRLMALGVIGSELVGGVLLGLGLLIPLGATVVAATMLIAARTDHNGKGWFITGQGAEYATTNAVVAVALAAAGGGRYGLDDALGIATHGAGWAAGAAGGAIVAAAAVLAVFVRRVPAAAAGAPAAVAEG